MSNVFLLLALLVSSASMFEWPDPSTLDPAVNRFNITFPRESNVEYGIVSMADFFNYGIHCYENMVFHLETELPVKVGLRSYGESMFETKGLLNSTKFEFRIENDFFYFFVERLDCHKQIYLEFGHGIRGNPVNQTMNGSFYMMSKKIDRSGDPSKMVESFKTSFGPGTSHFPLSFNWTSEQISHFTLWKSPVAPKEVIIESSISVNISFEKCSFVSTVISLAPDQKFVLKKRFLNNINFLSRVFCPDNTDQYNSVLVVSTIEQGNGNISIYVPPPHTNYYSTFKLAMIVIVSGILLVTLIGGITYYFYKRL